MNFSDYPIEKKIKTLIYDLSLFYVRECFDSIPQEDSEGDIQKSHQLINDKFKKRQIDSFFFTINFQPILYPAYALLMFYKYNPKFAEYVNSLYMRDVQLIDYLHEYYHDKLEKRLEVIKIEENTLCEKMNYQFIRDNTESDNEEFYAVAAATGENEIFTLPPVWKSDKQINILNAEIWDAELRIDFIDTREGNNYCIKLFDNNDSLVNQFNVKAENSSEDINKKVIILNDFSYTLFFEDYNKGIKWSISKE